MRRISNLHIHWIANSTLIWRDSDSSAKGRSANDDSYLVGHDFPYSFPMISPTLLPFKSETIKGVVNYNLQQVMRQLGYDMSMIMVTREMAYSDLLTAGVQLMGEGKEQIISKFEPIFYLTEENGS